MYADCIIQNKYAVKPTISVIAYKANNISPVMEWGWATK